MFMLEFGAECTPKSISVKGASDVLGWVPVIGIVVETEIGWVALETGFSRQALDDHDACYAIYGPEAGARAEYRPPRGLEGEPFATGLASVGLQVSDIALAAVSHLHVDHSGGLPLLAAEGVPVMIQRREHDFGMDVADLGTAYYRPDYADRGIEWRLLDGDEPIAPGIQAISTPGHTPGHMSYRVDLPDTGPWIFTIDAADLGQNLFDRIPIGSAADPADEPEALPSLIRLLDLAEELDARVVPGHDPHFWRAARHPLGGHR